MHVAIDTTPLSSLHKWRGIGWYTKYLIESLRKYERGNSYTLFTRGEKIPKDADLVHYPYFDPFFPTLAWRHPVKVVVTIHDLIPIRFLPELRPGVYARLVWQLQKIKVRKVRAIITDSYVSKNDIVRFIGLPQERVHTVHLAAASLFRPIQDKQYLAEIRKKYQLNSDLVLYVGDINYNKNIPLLLHAFAFVLRRVPALRLILVGEAFLGNSSEARVIDSLLVKLRLQQKVTRVGFVSTEDLVGLYNLASVYVQPSILEGFGLPVLEAMACGCPVVITERGALPEVAGKAAIYVEAESKKSIAEGILKALSLKTGQRQKQRERGFRQAAKFSWKKTAHQTVKVYQSVLKDL